MERIIDGIKYDEDILIRYDTPVKKVNVEYGTKKIEDYAFQNCEELEEIKVL